MPASNNFWINGDPNPYHLNVDDNKGFRDTIKEEESKYEDDLRNEEEEKSVSSVSDSASEFNIHQASIPKITIVQGE